MVKRGKIVDTLPGWFAFVVAVIGMANAVQGQSSVTLAWDPSPDPALAGYKVYQGVVSQHYTATNDVGKAMSAKMTMLVPGATYYFAVTAYDTNRLESPFSGEISYTVPSVVTTVAKLQLSMNSARRVVLAGTAPALYTYAVLATKDFKTWTTNGTVSVNAGGGFQFTDPGSATNSRCFYRLQQISPSVAVSGAKLQLAVNRSNQPVLTGTAPALYTYAVLATKDLKTWTTNGTLTVGSAGTFQFTDPVPATNARCLYRLRQISP
jgi:hypothetical protein